MKSTCSSERADDEQAPHPLWCCAYLERTSVIEFDKLWQKFGHTRRIRCAKSGWRIPTSSGVEAIHKDKLVVVIPKDKGIVARLNVMKGLCIGGCIRADTIESVIEETQSLTCGLVKKGNHACDCRSPQARTTKSG